MDECAIDSGYVSYNMSVLLHLSFTRVFKPTHVFSLTQARAGGGRGG